MRIKDKVGASPKEPYECLTSGEFPGLFLSVVWQRELQDIIIIGRNELCGKLALCLTDVLYYMNSSTAQEPANGFVWNNCFSKR